jgi:hypothetical protein
VLLGFRFAFRFWSRRLGDDCLDQHGLQRRRFRRGRAFGRLLHPVHHVEYVEVLRAERVGRRRAAIGLQRGQLGLLGVQCGHGGGRTFLAGFAPTTTSAAAATPARPLAAILGRLASDQGRRLAVLRLLVVIDGVSL